MDLAPKALPTIRMSHPVTEAEVYSTVDEYRAIWYERGWRSDDDPDFAGDDEASTPEAVFLAVVEHGADSNVARPVGVPAIYWIGSAEPGNAADHDLWYSGS